MRFLRECSSEEPVTFETILQVLFERIDKADPDYYHNDFYDWRDDEEFWEDHDPDFCDALQIVGDILG